ncbi:hypothetical protein FF1_003791 [Malus domestica]
MTSLPVKEPKYHIIHLLEMELFSSTDT